MLDKIPDDVWTPSLSTLSQVATASFPSYDRARSSSSSPSRSSKQIQRKCLDNLPRSQTRICLPIQTAKTKAYRKRVADVFEHEDDVPRRCNVQTGVGADQMRSRNKTSSTDAVSKGSRISGDAYGTKKRPVVSQQQSVHPQCEVKGSRPALLRRRTIAPSRDERPPLVRHRKKTAVSSENLKVEDE